MSIEQSKLKNIIEAALFAVAHPMSVDQLLKLFDDDDRPSANAIKEVIQLLQVESGGRGVELKEIASGYRYQSRQEYSDWLSRLWEERPAKYSRAALETLALIAYRQPVTRAEIEDVRGVGVSSSIIKTMIEREWIRVVGHRDVPGRPALYATTRQFLDYFDMKSLEDLPSLAEIKDLEDLNPELDLPNPDDEREVQAKQTGEASEELVGDNQDQKKLLNPTGETGSAEEEILSEDEQAIEQQSDMIEAENVSGFKSDIESVSESESVSSAADIDGFEADNQAEIVEELDDTFEELKDVHTESNQDSFYAESEEQTDLDQKLTPTNTESRD